MKLPPKRQVPGPKSAELLQISRGCEPPCVSDQVPVVWDHAERVWVTDVDGNEYLDFTSGVLVTNIGHSHPSHVAAIRHQAGRLMNCYSFPTPERVTLSRNLLGTLPSNLDRVFLLTTGSEATEAALRVARRYTKKFEVLAFHGGFHGRTYGALSVAGNQATRRGFGPPVPGGIMAPYAYCYRCFYEKHYPECDFFCIDALDRILQTSSSGELGSVIVEPYQGAAGFIFPPDGWLKALETWCRDRNLLLIVDEIQSSFGRTGKLYAIEWENVQPQMLCLGKGFGSGVPSSALAAESRIFDSLAVGELSSTWGGNPLASAASIAVLEILSKEDLASNATRVGEVLKTSLESMQTKHKCLGDVRGKGLVIGLEIVDPVDGYAPAPDMALQILQIAAEHGMLLGKVGMHGNVIRIAPPLVITEQEAELGVRILDAVLGEVKA
ncbi:MAG: 4-aminobutyrate--2-oxoglutarate transaminase [Anaerolineae bacterium]|nr:MAG: 4-aminobutyrate--2-oxoglutarate transaminase [Anaerolineae bacterium]